MGVGLSSYGPKIMRPDLHEISGSGRVWDTSPWPLNSSLSS
jgi:hypothetical protein